MEAWGARSVHYSRLYSAYSRGKQQPNSDLDRQAEAQASLQCWLALPLWGYCVNDAGTPKSHRLLPQHDTPHARGAAINDQFLWVRERH